MASILTNSSAMVALQTLRTTNKGLADVQNQISTGKKVGNAKDNAAIFAITQTMQSDVSGFKAISESLSLGSSTIAVASNASKQIGDLLNEIKGKIVAANEGNVDRSKLQDEVASLRSQISGIVGAAQFNGLNLLQGAKTAAAVTAGDGRVSVLSSLDRASNGTVTSSSITVNKNDLTSTAQVFSATGGADVAAASYVSATPTQVAIGTTGVPVTTAFTTIAAAGVSTGIGYQIDIDGTGTAFTAATYVAKSGDTAEDVANNLAKQYQRQIDAGTAGTITGVSVVANGTAGNFDIRFTNTGAALTGGTSIARNAQTAGGGLSDLAGIDVSTAAGARNALTDIEGLIQTTITAQAAFGTSEKRVDIQSDFMTSLIDSFKSGIGGLVDADLEEASARLQALQVQQQLGVQALSIANQAPQNILALFR